MLKMACPNCGLEAHELQIRFSRGLDTERAFQDFECRRCAVSWSKENSYILKFREALLNAH